MGVREEPSEDVEAMYLVIHREEVETVIAPGVADETIPDRCQGFPFLVSLHRILVRQNDSHGGRT